MYNNEDGLHIRLIGGSDQMQTVIQRMALAQDRKVKIAVLCENRGQRVGRSGRNASGATKLQQCCFKIKERSKLRYTTPQGAGIGDRK
jgi:transcription antitermination factor NusA-like protein